MNIWSGKSLVNAAHVSTPVPSETIAMWIEFYQFTVR